MGNNFYCFTPAPRSVGEQWQAEQDELARAARERRNAEALTEAEKRAEQSRIKLGVAALFGLRNI